MQFRSRYLPVLFLTLAPIGMPDTALAQTIYSDSTRYHLPASMPENGMDVEAVDIDRDGDLDIILANEFQPNVILFNDGTGHFTNASIGRLPQVVHDSEDIAVADFDGDGDLDIVFVSEDDHVHEYYLNDGTAHFTDVSSRLPQSTANAVAAADLTGDGFPDLVIGNAGQDLFLVNDGKGSFIDETATRLPKEENVTQDLELADIDADGDLDMVIGNEDGDKVLVNDGKGHFTDETGKRADFPATMETRKVTFADVDLDGDLDFFLSNVAFIPGKDPQDRLYLNDGEGHFLDGTINHLPADYEHTLDGKFVDVDGDGDLDLITGNFPNRTVKAFLNDGTGVFTEASATVLPPDVTGSVLGLEIADLDGDGVADIYVCNRGEKDRLLLARPRPGSSSGVKESEAMPPEGAIDLSLDYPFLPSNVWIPSRKPRVEASCLPSFRTTR